MGGHVGTHIGAVMDIGGFPEGRIGPARVMVVPAQHNGAHRFVSNHLVKLQGNGNPALGILVKNPGLAAHHQFVFLCVPDPDIVITVFGTSLGINTVHGRLVRFVQILWFSAQTHPSERPIAISKIGPMISSK